MYKATQSKKALFSKYDSLIIDSWWVIFDVAHLPNIYFEFGQTDKKHENPFYLKKETKSQSLKMKNWSLNCKSWRHHRNIDYVINNVEKPSFLKRNHDKQIV